MTLKQIVEALVFASPKPLSTKEIISALKSAGNPEKTDDATALEHAKAKEDDVLPVLAEIQAELETTGRAFQLVEQVNGWSFVTVPSAVHWVRQLYPEAKPTRLTGPQLETLAIIAYRQPVTRADIEAVRGVAVDGVVQVLMERSLIKIAGRADVPGRPLLYETTEYFLQHFGLKAVTELPNSAELRRIELPKAEHAEPETPKEKTRKAKQSEEVTKKEEVAAEGAVGESSEPPPGADGESDGSAEAVETAPAPESAELVDSPATPQSDEAVESSEAHPSTDSPDFEPMDSAQPGAPSERADLSEDAAEPSSSPDTTEQSP